MNAKNRTRMLWATMLLVIVYAIVNVCVYFLSGTFGVGWFVTSLVVYALALGVAVVLVLRDRPEEEASPEDTAATASEAADESPLATQPAAGDAAGDPPSTST